MVQGQNFHILNAGKILTEENGTLFTQGVGQDHKKWTQNMQKSYIRKPEIKILLYFKYECAMKNVLKVVSYMSIPSSVKHVSNSRTF